MQPILKQIDKVVVYFSTLNSYVELPYNHRSFSVSLLTLFAMLFSTLYFKHILTLCLQYVSKLTPALMGEIDKILGNKPAAKREVMTRWLDSRTPSASTSGPGHGSTSHPIKGTSSEVGGATCVIQWSTEYKHLFKADSVVAGTVMSQKHDVRFRSSLASFQMSVST